MATLLLAYGALTLALLTGAALCLAGARWLAPPPLRRPLRLAGGVLLALGALGGLALCLAGALALVYRPRL